MIVLRLQRLGINVQFCSVPAHVEGNEKTVEVAKRTLKLNDDDIMIDQVFI